MNKLPPESTEENQTPHSRRIRSFVVRAGRMTAGQERAWQELWPRFGIEYTAAPIDIDRVFNRPGARVLEIGFGTGDALLAYAQLHPDHNCIGIEVHPPGVGHLMLKAQELGITNIRTVCHDAVDVLDKCVPAQSLDEVHIFFPDPWHKKRHHKRRLIQPPFIDLLARVVKPNGIVRLATDWQNYAEHMLSVMDAHSSFENIAYTPTTTKVSSEDSQLPSGFVARLAHRPLTRFERRGHRLGHGVWDLAYRRRTS
jgi:tRNA (guanine-N7-)-methyltransferase